MQPEMRLLVARKRMLTDRTAEFQFVDPSGSDLPSFEPGSHIDVHTPGGLIRQYSLCGDQNDRTQYRIAVLREVSGSGGSAEMVDRVDRGDILGVSRPRNNFHLSLNPSESVLLAGGIGITPLLSMAIALDRAKKPFRFHYYCRSEKDAAFAEELRQSPFFGNVRLNFDSGTPDPEQFREKVLRGVSPQAHFYICGPSPFIDFARNALIENGLPRTAIHFELFKKPVQEIRPGQEFRIVLRQSRREFLVPPDRSVVDVLYANGIEIAVSCQEGLCGTCITSVHEGIPDHRDYVLSEDDRRSGKVFTPCCSRSLTDTLVLDL